MIDNWDQHAQSLGYPTERALLEDWYLTKQYSITEIATRLNISKGVVNRRLVECKIGKRTRGGANNKAAKTHKLYWMDQRIIMREKLEAIAREILISPSLIYKYRRARGGMKVGLLCDITDSRLEEVFVVGEKTLSALPHKDTGLRKLLPGDESSGGSTDIG